MNKLVNTTTLLISFIKERFLLYGTYSFLCLLIFFTFYLWEFPLEAFFDAIAFSFLILLLFSGYRFWRYYHIHQELERIKNLTDFHSSQLPLLPSTNHALLEADYRELFLLAVTQKEQLQSVYEEQNKQLVDYYSMWSHQIKTPLAALDLLVQSQPEPSPAMKAELFKMEEYLNMMLHYLKMNHVNDDLLLRKIDLNQLIRLTVKKYATFFIQKDLRLVIEPVTATVVSDEKWLTFIFEQILFNAIKYTPIQGNISIYFQNDTLIIEDTGIGILPEDLPRIFEQGYTGFNGREYQKATGLGLYMSDTIAKKMGLRLSAESEIDKGTKLLIHFPQENFQIE